MQVRVDINKVEIMQTEQVNSGEYNTREIQFNIAENMRGLILKALFTKDYKTYEVEIENDSCMIPWEVLKTDGNCELGVYAYSVNGEVLEIRYSPEPTKFYINAGSYRTDVANGEEPTPTRTEVLEGKIKELDNKKVDKKEGYGLSQNDFTNELKDKLDNAGKQEDIDKLKAENQEQAEQINYLDKTLTRAEATGETINLTDSAETPCKISIDTNIKQDSREGYNEVDLKDGEYYAVNGSKFIVQNGVCQLSMVEGVSENFNIVVDLNKPLTIPANTDFTISNGVTTYPYITLRDSNNVSIVQMNNADGGIKSFSFEEEKIVAKMNVYFNYSKGNISVKPMLLKGNYTLETLPPFEQYGAMPSIEFSSEIKTPVGKQEVYVGNKNFLNFKKWYENKDILISNSSSITLNEITENSITFTPSSNDAFTNTYAMSSTNINENKAKYETWSGISLKENTKYTVSYEKNVSAIRFMLFFLDKDFNYLGLIDNIGNGQVITTPAKTKYITYRVGAVNSKDVSITVKNIQIEEGTVATEYTPHQSQVQDLDLTSELLGTIVEKEDGSYFENRYKRLRLTSDMSWNIANNVFYTTSISDYKSVINRIMVYSNIFKGRNNVVVSSNVGDNECCFYVDNKTLRFYCKSSITDLSEWKKFLDNNVVEIVYELETPTYTKLTETQQAQWNKIKKMHTYEGVTNIYTINDNGISPVINLEYVKSPKLVEENLQAQIDKLKNSIISMGGNV